MPINRKRLCVRSVFYLSCAFSLLTTFLKTVPSFGPVLHRSTIRTGATPRLYLTGGKGAQVFAAPAADLSASARGGARSAPGTKAWRSNGRTKRPGLWMRERRRLNGRIGCRCAKVAELADAPDLGSGPARGGGSNPPFRTTSVRLSPWLPASPRQFRCNCNRARAVLAH